MPKGWFDRIWASLWNRKPHPSSGEMSSRSWFPGAALWAAVVLFAVVLASIAALPVVRHWHLSEHFDSIGDLRTVPVGSSVRLRGTVTYFDPDHLLHPGRDGRRQGGA